MHGCIFRHPYVRAVCTGSVYWPLILMFVPVQFDHPLPPICMSLPLVCRLVSVPLVSFLAGEATQGE